MNSAARDFITVVSGLPRSGTSLMMQMLQAGGIPALTDAVRSADPDNPRGYYELEAVKQLKTSKDWLSQAVGKSVKIVHMLLPELPVTHNYRVVFMHRDLGEVVRSQALMLERSGRPASSMSAERLSQVYAGQMAMVRKWLDERTAFRLLDVQYADIVKDPLAKSGEVNSFLGGTLDVNAMAAAVDPSLYRNRAPR